MLKYADTAIVFQEIPDELTLAVNLTHCPCRCPGCHSKHLWADTGTPLTDIVLDKLVADHPHITCLSIMGGDADPAAVDRLFSHLRHTHPHLHTAWWSGRSMPSPLVHIQNLDYIKLGPYLAHLGPLNSPRTNQRLYRVAQGRLLDITHRLQKAHTALTQLLPSEFQCS